ncbi:uncharacterized protein LOC117893608 [Drosophila subobscura]|uniref:uncharacterized protein LOC117893608 n=1 Tax=Drosophila subobscura TaxID=7241 RepID=UPI00155A9D4C|nr:uncharacterized protein LOC117893608 [Drosophila subobscura]
MFDLKKRSRQIRAICNVIYNDPFLWDVIKSYTIFAAAIPIAHTFNGYKLMP